MNKVGRYFQGVVKEGKRVRWPNRETVLKSLGIVLFITIVVAIWLWMDDQIAGKLLQILQNTFGAK